MKTAIILGTGPSITPEISRIVKEARFAQKVLLFGCNNTIFHFPLDVHHACNYQWHDFYHTYIENKVCDFWTTRPEVGQRYPFVKYIEERWIPGLSTDKHYIAAHHGTGPQLINIAYHYGYRRMLLVGWDMRHKGKRHFFGEYPQPLHHVTRNLGPDGELIGLIKEMETIKPEDYGLQIINCTADSALECFPYMPLEDAISTP